MFRTARLTFVLGLATASLAYASAATVSENVPLGVEPTAKTHALADLASVPVLEAARVDFASVALEDSEREVEGLPPRFAIPNEVRVTPATAGKWETIDE